MHVHAERDEEVSVVIPGIRSSLLQLKSSTLLYFQMSMLTWFVISTEEAAVS